MKSILFVISVLIISFSSCRKDDKCIVFSDEIYYSSKFRIDRQVNNACPYKYAYEISIQAVNGSWNRFYFVSDTLYRNNTLLDSTTFKYNEKIFKYEAIN